jgi:hypothetical protein
MPNLEVGRILVMGCSRSGTTLLQSLLASHSQVHPFPETGVFLRAFGMRGTLLPWTRFGLTLGKERKALAALLSTVDSPQGPQPPMPPRRILLSRSLSDVVGFLDSLAEAHGKEFWVEKTPRHVLHAARIGRSIPGARCVHVVRRGEDVVASIVDRARNYPDRFSGQEDPSYGIRQWNQSIGASVRALKDPGHALVFYEALAKDPEATMRALCPFLGLEFEPDMVIPADRAAFSHPSEEWKNQVNSGVAPAESKFGRLFDARTRAGISQKLKKKEALQGLRVKASREPGAVLVSPV